MAAASGNSPRSRSKSDVAAPGRDTSDVGPSGVAWLLRALRPGSFRRLLRYGVVGAVLAGAVILIVSLAEEARREFQGLSTAGLDNMVWTASQLEVDVLRLLAEAERLTGRPEMDAAALGSLRTRYDILYSRANILSRSVMLEALAEDRTVIDALDRLRAFLDRYEPLIDGEDALLMAAVPALRDDTERLHGESRQMVLRIIDHFARDADEKRAGLAALLQRIAVATVALLLVLSALLVLLARLYRRQQRAQAELRVARDAALAGQRAKASFIAVMSHEMRTPLNGILASLELVLGRIREPKQKQFVELAHASALQLMHQINDVLDISKIEAGRIEIEAAPFEPGPLLEAAIASLQPLAEARGNAIGLELAPGVPRAVQGDVVRLRQILQNFLSNAIKFTENGRITVAARPAGNGLLEISVADSGIGIARDDLERVFEDFVMLDPTYSREVGGSGLGLSICRRLASAMGGEVGAESTKGAGSRFWVRLPLPEVADAPATKAPDSPVANLAVPDGGALPGGEAPAPAAGGLCVLVADDNAVNRTVIAQMLLDLGHQPHLAANGREAVALARETAFDAILMDISMPEMDGVTAAGHIRAAGRSVTAPIFALTAHAMPDELARFEAAGLRTTLLKPVRMAALRTALAGLVPERPSAEVAEAQGSPDRVAAGVASSIAQTPLVDAATLAEQRELLGESALAAIQADFAADAQRLLTAISAAEAAGDTDRVRRHAHELKGAAATLGCARLAGCLRALEESAGLHPPVSLAALLVEARKILDESLVSLGVEAETTAAPLPENRGRAVG